MTLAGTMVGYEVGEWEVLVRDLRTGRTVHRTPTGFPLRPKPDYIGVGNVVALVLKSDGSVAWIAEDYERTTGVGSSTEAPYFDVEKLDKAGPRLLAAGADIDPASLALAASATNIGYTSTSRQSAMVFWTQANKPFSAPLNEPGRF